MLQGNVLVVDDEAVIRAWVRETLAHAGHTVIEAENGEAALKLASSQTLDLALVDLKLPDTDGIALMRDILNVSPHTSVIIMTAYSSVSNAVKAMKLGAYDYLAKPLDPEDLVMIASHGVEASTLRREVNTIHANLRAQFGFHNIVGRSRALQELIRLARRVAQSEATTVLIRGESGVGKDLLARAIHYESRRALGAFVPIACTALQPTLLESELFGHEKGAFTDAKEQKRGLFEIANGGTAFLDEIGDMSPTLQAKLLRFLENKHFRRVGGTEDLYADVRVIAATNRDLETQLRDGSFRADLYYRLNVIPIHIPPLRDRPEDIPLLTQHFVDSFNREFRKQIRGVSREAMQVLSRYPWPGNVRELRNVIERAMLLAAGPSIQPEDLLIHRSGPPATTDELRLPPGGVNLDELERSFLEQALERTGWNQVAAARLLCCTRDQIRYRMKKFGLERRARSAPAES